VSDEVDSRISPSLHPLNAREVEGYSEATAPAVASTEHAFRRAYQGLQAVHDARAIASKNEAWTEAQVVIETDKLARKYQDSITRAFDNAHEGLRRDIETVERELSSPVTSKASLGIAQEVRAHVKGLKPGERMGFVRNLIESGDDSVTAVLGGPAFLSGIDGEAQAVFTRMYHEKQNPAAVARLTAMRGAAALIESNGPLVFRELEKAVGAPPHKAKALREANTAAEKAMVMRDVA
jgi:hypothetical protein